MYFWRPDPSCADNNALEVNRLFTGQEFDKESGLYYYNARYYDPNVGVFMTPDPAMDGLNHYGYAKGNPIKYQDPTGTDAEVERDPKTFTITIKTLIYIYGEGADDETAKGIKEDIEKEWQTDSYKDKYNVEWKVKTKATVVNIEGKENKNEIIKNIKKEHANAILIAKPQNGNSFISLKGNSGVIRERNTWEERGNPSSHETGHLLGLDDRYDRTTKLPLPGWEGNIMAEEPEKGHPDQRNFDTILRPAFEDFRFYYNEYNIDVEKTGFR